MLQFIGARQRECPAESDEVVNAQRQHDTCSAGEAESDCLTLKQLAFAALHNGVGVRLPLLQLRFGTMPNVYAEDAATPAEATPSMD